MTSSIASSARSLIASAAVERLRRADLVDGPGGGHHERVAVVGAEVGHPAVDDDLHHLALAAERRQRAARRRCDLASVTRSGCTPSRWAAPAWPAVRPVLTSSKIRTTPCCVAQGAHAGEVALVGHDDREVLDHRLDDEGGDLGAVLRPGSARASAGRCRRRRGPCRPRRRTARRRSARRPGRCRRGRASPRPAARRSRRGSRPRSSRSPCGRCTPGRARMAYMSDSVPELVNRIMSSPKRRQKRSPPRSPAATA